MRPALVENSLQSVPWTALPAIGVLVLVLDSVTNERARRALSHGGGIDGIFFMLMAAAGIGLVVVLLVAGLRTAETNATRDMGRMETQANPEASEIGTN